MFFTDTVVSYRDDNRHLWTFIEPGDEEDSFAAPRPPAQPDIQGLPPRHYPEWDAATQDYRPDWVSVYEALHAGGDAGLIDRLLTKHAVLARQLERLLDQLKPQDRVRMRYQEQGSELDLDVALRSLIDWRAGAMPDPRILMSHRTDGRSIAVLLLLDLSASLNDAVPGTGQTRLALSQEAVALLAWAIDRLGDPFAIAGFHSNTRHEVRYQHILGFSERWGDAPKGRLAAVQAAYSTRMGAAMRHAAHYLGAQKADKKLLLVLTDGEPADVDVSDPRALILDTRQAVKELTLQGIHSHCISLDPHADAYVRDIFWPPFHRGGPGGTVARTPAQTVHGADGLSEGNRQDPARGRPRQTPLLQRQAPAQPARTGRAAGHAFADIEDAGEPLRLQVALDLRGAVAGAANQGHRGMLVAPGLLEQFFHEAGPAPGMLHVDAHRPLGHAGLLPFGGGADIHQRERAGLHLRQRVRRAQGRAGGGPCGNHQERSEARHGAASGYGETWGHRIKAFSVKHQKEWLSAAQMPCSIGKSRMR